MLKRCVSTVKADQLKGSLHDEELALGSDSHTGMLLHVCLLTCPPKVYHMASPRPQVYAHGSHP